MKKIITLSLIFFSISFCHELDYVYKPAIPSHTDTPNDGMFRFTCTKSQISSSLSSHKLEVDYYGKNASGATFNIEQFSYMQDGLNFYDSLSTSAIEFGYYYLWNDIDDVPFRGIHHDRTFSSTRIKTSFGGYAKTVAETDEREATTESGGMAAVAFDFIVGEKTMLTTRLKSSYISEFSLGMVCSINRNSAFMTEYLFSPTLAENSEDNSSNQWLGIYFAMQFLEKTIGHHTYDLKLVPKFYMPISTSDNNGYGKFNLSLVFDFI